MKRLTSTALLILSILSLTAFGCRNSGGSNTNTVNTNVTVNQFVSTNTPTTNTVTITNTPQPQRSPVEDELRRLASSFTERYGSYSNQTNFTNLESLYFFMTNSFQSETKAFVEVERAKQRDTTVYYGISTQATSAHTQQFNEESGVASFLVETQRREAIGTTSNIRSFQATILVDMRREGGTWKVQRALWQQ